LLRVIRVLCWFFSQTIVYIISLLLLLSRLFRLSSYKVFLRCYQTLTIVVAYAFWKYISSQSKLSCIYLLISNCTFAIIFVLEYLIILYRNIIVGRNCSRILIARHNYVVRITIFLARLWKIKVEQYINM